MENPAETGVLPGDPFSAQYEVNSNEKDYAEGTKTKVETGGSGQEEQVTTETVGIEDAAKDQGGVTSSGNGDVGGFSRNGHVDEDDVVMADVEAEEEGALGVDDGYRGDGTEDQTVPEAEESRTQNGGQLGESLFMQH